MDLCFDFVFLSRQNYRQKKKGTKLMARKGENIYKRKDGRWEGRHIRGRRPDGTAVYGSVYGKKYGEVKDKLIPLKSAYATREQVKVSFIGTVWDWLFYWLEELEKPHIKQSTYASYRGKLENHVLPVLGDIKLSRPTEGNIQEWIDGLSAKGLAGSSVNVVFRIFNAAMQKAVYKHCLFVNPCAGVVLPDAGRPEINALTLTEQKELEKQALAGKGNEAVMIALYTGMRIGEISALTWEDIDFDNNLIYVRRTLQRITDYDKSGTKIIIDLPKSDTSYRVIPFAGHLRELLWSWKAASNSGYVISCKGSFAEPRVISYRFRQAANKAGLANATFHSLRHTCATRCLERSVDIATLSRLLGHASVKMTLDTYADSTMEQRKTAMTVLDMLLPKDSREAKETDAFVSDKQNFVMLLTQLFKLDLSAVF